LDLTKRRVTAYKNEEILVSYPVAVGKKGWETPKGSFKVIQMIKNPTWQNPWNGKVMPAGPNTALGERWIGFWTNGKDTIGFHGTPTVNSIGKAASHGCVRMYNKDVKELFPILSEWDTKYAVLVGAQPQQTIHGLYLMLADLSQMSDNDLQGMLDDQESLRRIKQRFLELFLSLKNDLGIYSLKSPSAITNTKDPSSFAEVDELSGIKEQRYMINKVPPSRK
jgi:hypothetical protein